MKNAEFYNCTTDLMAAHILDISAMYIVKYGMDWTVGYPNLAIVTVQQTHRTFYAVCMYMRESVCGVCVCAI